MSENIIQNLEVFRANTTRTKFNDKLESLIAFKNNNSDIKEIFGQSSLSIIENNEARKEIEVEIASNAEAIVDIHEKIEKFLSLYFSEELDITLGFYELLVNAAEHGNGFNPEKKVLIKIILDYQVLKIIVSDQGAGFNWRKKCNQAISIDDFEDRGRGINLAQLLVDEIIYNEVGNKVTLIKNK